MKKNFLQKIFLGCFICLFSVFVVSCKKNEFEKNTVYLFWQDGCSHCHHAISYIDENYSNISVEKLNIAEQKAVEKLKKGLVQYKINTNVIATPLFIINDEVIMGWSSQSQEKFIKAVNGF